MKIKNFVALGLTAGITNLAQAIGVAGGHAVSAASHATSHVATHTAMIAAHGAVHGQAIQNTAASSPDPLTVGLLALGSITAFVGFALNFNKMMDDLHKPSPIKPIPMKKFNKDRIIELRTIFKEIDEENLKSSKSNKI